MPKCRRKECSRKTRKLAKVLSALLILTGVLTFFLYTFNVPILTINCGDIYLNTGFKRNLSVRILTASVSPEGKYMRMNASHIQINIIVDGENKTLATVPITPGETIYVGNTLSFNITKEELPIKVFAWDNITKSKYLVVLVSSPQRTYFPLRTFLLEAALESYIVNYDAVIHVNTSVPLVLKVVLHHASNITSTKVVGPLTGRHDVSFNESFMYLIIYPYMKWGFFYLRIKGNTASLYPQDNTVFFASLITLLIAVGIITPKLMNLVKAVSKHL